MPSTNPEDRAAVWEAPPGVEQVMNPSTTTKSLCSSPSLCLPSLHPPRSHSLHPLLVSTSPAPLVYALPCPPASTSAVSLPYAPLPSVRPPLSTQSPPTLSPTPVSSPICVVGGGKVADSIQGSHIANNPLCVFEARIQCEAEHSFTLRRCSMMGASSQLLQGSTRRAE